MAVAMATFLDFSVLNFVIVPQPKSMHGFSPIFQDKCNLRGSRAY